ncbi:hypothetical protein BDQ12DRAFT_729001 [Crucibulum laeve]|uniref:F-box domain-containing protein n=1 Tax=Crucibulum laeve TaxID=68775 RepID=A0A5C3LGW5_9AGAR|nr:hypothetical protein BDQ12DRAFT_729001 [Crucibulum laeve]
MTAMMDTPTITPAHPSPPSLSAEIIILIIEEIAGQRSDKDFRHALLACSSVSHFFHSISQAHIFAVVDYTNVQLLTDDLIRARATSLKSLLVALESKPYLGQLIREFHLYVDPDLSSDAWIATIACILGYCRKLELFYFRNTAFWSWTAYPDALSCAVEDIIRYNSLLALTLVHVQEFPLSLIFCPTVKKLQLCNVTVDVPRNNYFQNDYAGAIESLHIVDLYHRVIQNMLSSGFDLSHLRHLKLKLFDLGAHNSLRIILDKCNQSLETLSCNLNVRNTMENASMQNQNVLNFQSLTALHALTLCLDGTKYNFSWGSAMQHYLVKSSVAQNTTIKEIVFHAENLRYFRDDTPHNETTIDSLELEHIQGVLMDVGGFTVLHRVVLNIHPRLIMNGIIQTDWTLSEEEKEWYRQRLKERLAKLSSTSRFQLLFAVHESYSF